MKKEGFTLIELLIVIAIIGILASIILVSLSELKRRAQRASLLTTASSIMAELVICLDDSGGMTVPNDNSTGGGVICTANNHMETWPDISQTGWEYFVEAKNPIAEDDTYEFTRAGEPNVVCTIPNKGCL